MNTDLNLDGDTIELTSNPSTMSPDIVQKLVDNYRNNQLNIINTKLGIDDAHSIWFDLVTLKKFIADIENEVQKVDTNITQNDLGVRFYYAAYPELQNWDMMENMPIGQEYAGKHTLVMVPTLKQENQEGKVLDYDFNPLDSSTYVQNNENEQTEIVAMKKVVSAVFSQNHGNLIPPDNKIVEQY